MDSPEIEARLTAVLGDLEEVEVELTNRQAKLARELADVDAQLERIQTVKAVIHGKPKPKAKPRGGGAKKQAEINRERVLKWARTMDGKMWTPAECVEGTGIDQNAAGPILGGIVRQGLAERVEEDGKPYFRLTTEGSAA